LSHIELGREVEGVHISFFFLDFAK